MIQYKIFDIPLREQHIDQRGRPLSLWSNKGVYCRYLSRIRDCGSDLLFQGPAGVRPYLFSAVEPSQSFSWLVQATFCPGQEICIRKKPALYKREEQSVETSLEADNVRPPIDVLARDDGHGRGQRQELSGAGCLRPCHIRACSSISAHNGQSC